MQTETLRQEVQSFHDQLVGRQANIQLLTEQLQEKQGRQNILEDNQKRMRMASMLIERAATEARMGLKERFEQVVGAALKRVFGEDYEFKVVLESKRNATWAKFAILSDDMREPQDPLFARGGSTVDVCAIALRLVYMEVEGRPGFLLMDEPGQNISEKHLEATAEMIEQLHRMTGRQLLVITHHKKFKELWPTAIDLDPDAQ